MAVSRFHSTLIIKSDLPSHSPAWLVREPSAEPEYSLTSHAEEDGQLHPLWRRDRYARLMSPSPSSSSSSRTKQVGKVGAGRGIIHPPSASSATSNKTIIKSPTRYTPPPPAPTQLTPLDRAAHARSAPNPFPFPTISSHTPRPSAPQTGITIQQGWEYNLFPMPAPSSSKKRAWLSKEGDEEKQDVPLLNQWRTKKMYK